MSIRDVGVKIPFDFNTMLYCGNGKDKNGDKNGDEYGDKNGDKNGGKNGDEYGDK